MFSNRVKPFIINRMPFHPNQ